MSGTTEHPQLYVITPPASKLVAMRDVLAASLDASEIACVRLNTGAETADDISKAADLVRELCHVRDIALVIDGHPGLVEPLGLDGVHLSGAAKTIREARKLLGSEAVVGAHAGLSKHDGLTAGEIGVDYVAFGPIGDTGLGDIDFVDSDLFAWWSLMVELPVIAEGGITLKDAALLAPQIDFLALGAELWRSDDPAQTLKDYAERLAI
ncbi:MAG: thiamine phosphate synthase [Pseudomonadota bacterium]